MEEFKQVQWDLLTESLISKTKEQLISTVISKQMEIDQLKYEVSNL